MNLTLRALLSAIFLTASVCFAEKPKDDQLKIYAPEMIEIKRYDSQSEIYYIEVVSNRAVGRFTTPEAIAKSIKTIELKKKKDRPKPIVGINYSLDRDLELLYDFQLGDRKRKPRKTANAQKKYPQRGIASE